MHPAGKWIKSPFVLPIVVYNGDMTTLIERSRKWGEELNRQWPILGALQPSPKPSWNVRRPNSSSYGRGRQREFREIPDVTLGNRHHAP